MSAGLTPGGGGRGHADQDFELNLASIIDCFTVLIAFMLVSAAFVSIGILDAGVAAAGAIAKDGPPPPIQITLSLALDQSMELKVTGKMTSEAKIPAKNGAADYEKLGAQLSGIKQQWSEASAMTLVPDTKVAYRDVVKTMEVARKSMPAVLLGGF
jgi:biopolymer transport protein ExbD